MKLQRLYLLPAAALMVLAIGVPGTALAEIRYVVTDTSQCPTGTPTPPCYTSLTEAITAAAAGDSIEIRPGTYTGNFTLNKSVSIYGNETARTFLSGGGSSMALTVDGVTTAISIRRLTFINATVGLLVRNSPSVTVSNNVFEVGNTSTAIQTTTSSGTQVINNTFYKNGTGVLSDLNTLSIINNIFSNGATAISSNVAVDGILNNLFFANTNIGPTGIIFDKTNLNYKGNISDQDPLFVDLNQSDITKLDFHLKSGTPCKDAGNATAGTDKIDNSTADIGAYGGSQSDTIPFPVQNVVPQDISSPPTYAVRLTWDTNTCYQIAGYKIHYGTASGSYTTTTDVGNVVTYDATSLSPAAAPGGTPPVLSNGISNGTILLTWDASGVTGATGYEVRYSDTTTPPPAPGVDAGNATSYALTGLTNGTSYYVSVTPYAQATYYFTVTAYYTNTAFESDYSDEKSLTIGNKGYGSSSNIIYDYPESITAYPNLPSKGCFIATAAYGYYSAPQVQALREFRDRYLMTNTQGRAFVRWYYTYGPVAAQFINEHPGLKPAVRVALLPAVGGAMFMTRTSTLAKTILFVVLGLLALYASPRTVKTRRA